MLLDIKLNQTHILCVGFLQNLSLIKIMGKLKIFVKQEKMKISFIFPLLGGRN